MILKINKKTDDTWGKYRQQRRISFGEFIVVKLTLIVFLLKNRQLLSLKQ